MPVTVEFYKIWKREKIKKRIIMHKHAHKTTYLGILLYMNTCNQKDTLSLPYNPPSPKNMNTHTTVTCTQNNPTSSLHFHQNIADEVLSSINHASALLHSPPINHKAHHTAGSVLSFWEGLCCHLFCIHNYTPTALIHTPASRYAHNHI